MDFQWLSNAALDFRFAARTFARRPGFTAVAAVTLAVGIGATTAVFSIVEAVLLRPLPYKNPDRLAAVWITSTREKGLAKMFTTRGDYDALRREARSFENMGAATWATRTGRVLTGWGPAREVLTIPASASLFETLGVSAALGRTFGAEDEGRGCSLLVAYKFWTSTLRADPSIIGKNLTFDEQPCTVLGVMPEQFVFYPRQTQAWILLGPNFQPDQDRMLAGIFARLKPGVTIAQAESELRSIYRAIHLSREAQDFEPVVYDLHGEFTFLAGRTLRTTMILVFAAVLFLLLIACLNVANLTLARLSERQRELAVRAALGSGKSRLVRQLLTEGLLLSGLGGALGLAIVYATVRWLRVANPIELSPGANVEVNLPVMVFSGALLIVTTLIFGLLPAIRGSRADLTQHLKTGRGSVQGRHRLGKFVIAVEMALSFLLLIGAGLFMTSALRMGTEPLGFNPDRLLVTRVSLPVFRYSTGAQRLHCYDRLLERLKRVPGVGGVTLASKVPPEAGGNQNVEIYGRPAANGHEIHDVGADAVSPGFFDALNVRLRSGRDFGAQDRENSPPVAIVNEAFAEKYFAKGRPAWSTDSNPGRSHALADCYWRGWKPETHGTDE